MYLYKVNGTVGRFFKIVCTTYYARKFCGVQNYKELYKVRMGIYVRFVKKKTKQIKVSAIFFIHNLSSYVCYII